MGLWRAGVRRVAGGPAVNVLICLICGTAIASPWILWQFWQFVAAGLYPNERKYITRHIPLSIGLLITTVVTGSRQLATCDGLKNLLIETRGAAA